MSKIHAINQQIIPELSCEAGAFVTSHRGSSGLASYLHQIMASPFGLALSSLPFSPSNLALLPLLSTTASTSITIYEAVFFTGLLKASYHDRASVARTVSLWWTSTLPESLTLVTALSLASTLCGYRAIRTFGRGSRDWYVAIVGTLFAAGHFAFESRLARIAHSMTKAYDGLDTIEAKEEGSGDVVDERVVDLQRRWLTVHAWRSLVTDGPAMACFGWLAMAQ